MKKKGLIMQKTFYYKDITIGGKKFRIFTKEHISNEEFDDKLQYVRRVFGYAMYPRWYAIRMLLGDTCDMLRKNGLYCHRVKKMAKILIKEFDAFERLHTMDFDEDWIDVMSGSMAMQLQPKLAKLRGAIGGIMLNRGMKNYILYSYPQTICILAREGILHHDCLMEEVKEKYGMDLSQVFHPLRGDKVMMCAWSLMSAIEDAVKEKLPEGIDVTTTLCADKALKDFELALIDDKLLSKAFGEAQEECDMRDFNENTIADKLSQKYNVKRL